MASEIAVAAKRMPDTCICWAPLKETRSRHLSHWGDDGRWVLVTDVPVFQCELCGNEYLKDDVADRLEQLVRAGEGEEITIVTVRFGEKAKIRGRADT